MFQKLCNSAIVGVLLFGLCGCYSANIKDEERLPKVWDKHA